MTNAVNFSFAQRSLQLGSCHHHWPLWLRPWKTSTVQMMNSVTRPPRTPDQNHHKMRWPSLIGTSPKLASAMLHQTQAPYFLSCHFEAHNVHFFFCCLYEPINVFFKLLPCQQGVAVLPLFITAFSCLSPLGSSLRLVGSALCDRAIITWLTTAVQKHNKYSSWKKKKKRDEVKSW